MYKHLTKQQFKEHYKNKESLTNKERAKMVNYTFLIRQQNIHWWLEKVYLWKSNK